MPPAAAGAIVATQPLGVAALSYPRPSLGKSSSLPNLNRTASSFAVGGRGVVGGGPLSPTMGGGGGGPLSPMSPMSPSKLPASIRKNMSPSAVALMSATFSPDGRGQPVWNGRMAMQGYWGLGPPSTGVFKKVMPKGVYEKQHVFEPKTNPATKFRRFFERGDLPIKMKHGATPGVEWKVEPERLDYVYHLPIFFEGLLERTEPFATMAFQGLQDLLNAARGKQPSLLAPCIATIIVPIKTCLNTKDNVIMCRAINMLQLLIRCDTSVGEILVPYYRQLLPVMSLFRGNNKNLGDGIEYGQRKRENMGDLVAETLELFERTGGEDAFINIKYMIPTYESCMVP